MKTIQDIFNNLSERQKDVAYELIGQALEIGDYYRGAFFMFNKEEQLVIKYLLGRAMKGE